MSHRRSCLTFLIGVALLVSGALYLQHRAELRQAHLDSLYVHIEELTESYELKIYELTDLYNKTTEQLKGAEGEITELNSELQDALQKIETVEDRNRYLEQILFNQTKTYRNAVAMNGSTMPVLSVSSFTANQYERAWSRLGAHGLMGTGAAMVRAEEIYGINSLVLAAIAFHESAAGRSRIAREKNNLFGLGAVDLNPFLYAYSFPTREESIYYAANLLKNSYLSRWGRHYRGDNLAAVGRGYATDPLWATKVARCMSQIARAAIPGGR